MLPDLADFYVSFRSGFSGEESGMLVWAGRDRDSSGLRPLGMTITFCVFYFGVFYLRDFETRN